LPTTVDLGGRSGKRGFSVKIADDAHLYVGWSKKSTEWLIVLYAGRPAIVRVVFT
jgi:hypothetical protein